MPRKTRPAPDDPVYRMGTQRLIKQQQRDVSMTGNVRKGANAAEVSARGDVIRQRQRATLKALDKKAGRKNVYK